MDLQENERVMVDWATSRRNAKETPRVRFVEDYDSTRSILKNHQSKEEETESKVAFKPSTI